ncbi:MAG TPA: hypothetical protein VK897_07860 [Anaerolineales bacterium]|nr:hypothetical protein [Anaerolineales bacterium]
MHRLSPLFLLLCSFLFHLACTPTPLPSLQASFYIYRFEPPAFIEFSKGFEVIREIPFSIPPHCGLFNVFPAQAGQFLAVELSCPNGQTVLYFDIESNSVLQPVRETDSHFLAWTPDGEAAYLKVDSLGNTQILRVFTEGEQDSIPISNFTYDLSPSPGENDITFTLSGGLGQGSELWLSNTNGKNAKQLYVDPLNYISFVRYSPDGSQIAFIKIPDTSTPFTVGELWMVNRDGSNARKLADADAGHGYAANWSPNGKQIAFVVRENPQDERANESSAALISNVYVIDVESGTLTQITHLEKGRTETAFWSPDGNTLAFTVVINDRMEVRIADITTGEIRSVMEESTCCPAWVRNR